MLRAETRTGKIGYLVVLESGSGKFLVRGEVHLQFRLVGQRHESAILAPAVERCPFVVLKIVERNMIGAKAEDLLEIGKPFIQSLIGQSEDEVDRDI